MIIKSETDVASAIASAAKNSLCLAIVVNKKGVMCTYVRSFFHFFVTLSNFNLEELTKEQEVTHFSQGFKISK